MTFKNDIKKSLKWLDYKLGIRAWLSSEPKERLEEPHFLKGEKDLDYGWVVANAGKGPGNALDVGFVNSPLSAILAALGFTVAGVDLRSDVPYDLQGFVPIQGDFIKMKFPANSFDLVVLCSTVEHIGLSGRYDNLDVPDGDIQAMRKVKQFMKPDGKCILTIPVGIDGVFSPWHRIYGRERFPLLIQDFKIESSHFYVKEGLEKWKEADSEKAFSFQGNASRYALGQFLLRCGEN